MKQIILILSMLLSFAYGQTNMSGAFAPGNLSGTTGQKLTSAGSGAAPIWKDTVAVTGVYLPLAGGTMTGNLLFTDNTFDIGASGATRPRTGYYGTSVFSPVFYGGTAVGSTLDLISTSGVGSTSAVRIKVGNNGGTTAVTFANSGAADFGSNAVTIGGNLNGFNGLFTGAVRTGAASTLSHNGRNIFTATSDGFETLTSSSTSANTAVLSVGALRTGYVAKTANYTATAFDETISCTTNAFTITLPTAVGCAGQKYNITNSGAANTITIATTSSQTFANVTATPTTLSLVGLGAVIVVSDGANWLQLK